MRTARSLRKRLPFGKRPRGARGGQRTPRTSMKPGVVVVAVVRNKAATTRGIIGGVEAEVMLDSGSSVSLVRQEVLSQAPKMPSVASAEPIQLYTASGDPLRILDRVRAPVKIGDLELIHEFVVVENLVSPVILGVDFLHNNGLVLDFSSLPVTVHTSDSVQVVPHCTTVPECIFHI